MQITLVDKDIEKIIDDDVLKSLNPNYSKDVLKKHLEPSSIDLPIGQYIYEINEVFMPHNKTVLSAVNSLKTRKIPLKKEVYLHKGLNYIVPVANITIPTLEDMLIKFSPKSSIGRVDLMVRAVADNVGSYEFLPSGFRGNIWNILSPQSFNLKVNFNKLQDEICLNQARFIYENKQDTEVPDSKKFLINQKGNPINRKPYEGNKFQVSLSTNDFNIMGYEALNTQKYLDMTSIELNNPKDFFKPIKKAKKFKFEKGKFYIMASKEKIVVPPEYSIEMVPASHFHGEIRVHYAGFFDPGFGYRNGKPEGNIAVFEIRAYENITVEDGQPICWIEVLKNSRTPSIDYSEKNGKNYAIQEGPKLAKYFKK
jgi:dCTP deaminase